MKTRSIVLAAALALSACGNPQSSKAQEGEFAQPTRSPPSDAAGMKSSFAPVVRAAAPAVVNITSNFPSNNSKLPSNNNSQRCNTSLRSRISYYSVA